jgi:pyrimidine-nucleoside phosphorylase
MDALTMIHTKRNNLRPHTPEELTWWIAEYSKGRIPDYQMSAWLMAVCWRGMTADETAVMTKCMVESGQRLTWPTARTIPPTILTAAAGDDNDNKLYLVDKHSTGGVGDKISLIVAPLVASFGVSVNMMAGRGLGHTGGTIDKLEAIDGYQTSLDISTFQRIVQQVGCSIVAASDALCLADRKLYGLRDVTGTVSSIPLQTSSILCKKIAEGPHSLVLDGKYGLASFQATQQDAQELAESMIRTGEANGLQPTTVFLTRMDSVLGYAAGNWCEVYESLQMLKTGQGANDVKQLVVVMAAQMLYQSGKYNQQTTSFETLVPLVLDQLNQGKAYPYFRAMVEAHGGDVSVCDNPDSYPHEAEFIQDVVAPHDGYISQIHGLVVGNLCVQLGAGRQTAGETVDPTAGIIFWKKVGDSVTQGQKVATLRTNRSMDVLHAVGTRLEQEALQYASTPVTVPPIISHQVTSSQGTTEFVLPVCLQ